MAFTDEDLKRLKEGLAAHVKFTDRKGRVFRPRVDLDAGKLSALLARLELSEIANLHAKALAHCGCDPERDCLNKQRFKESYKTWRKAAGE